MSQVSTTFELSAPDRPAPAWVAYLRTHAAIVRELSTRLQRAQGLTLNDFEVLLALASAEDGRLRRVDLAERVLLTASGITRLLEGLERAGYVGRDVCPGDARVSYAKLTESGRTKLREAAATHLEDVSELFSSRFSPDELETLDALLARLPKTTGACGETGCGA
jgi:DNA-binding MarR family transcriptional regulator